jgi:hypothetical protein
MILSICASNSFCLFIEASFWTLKESCFRCFLDWLYPNGRVLQLAVCPLKAAIEVATLGRSR